MKSIVGIVILGLFFGSTMAQNMPAKEILMNVDTMKISKSEFLYALNKNNYNKKKITKKDIEDYLDLYTKFKLKVRDAYARGYDTTTAFTREFNVYKNQLDDSYLTNDKWLDSLTKQVYNRLKYEIRASHILITVKNPTDPEDTMEAYNKIEKIYKLAKDGASFDKLAKEYSDDPTASMNGGDIGFFTALQLVLPFENMAYSTPVGSVSKPFKTKFGYHIIKVTDKELNPGTVTVAHIMLRYTRDMTKADSSMLKRRAEDIYSQLLNGGDWNKLCLQYSDDNNTRNDGGVLPSFGVGKMVPSFAEAAFSLLKPGDIHPPVESPYGWHIIKLIDKKPFRTYDDIHSELRERVKEDARYSMVQKMYIDQLARENNYSLDTEIYRQCIDLADNSLVKGEWKYNGEADFLKKILIHINNQAIDVSDFINYILQNERQMQSISPVPYMNQLYSGFREKKLMDYEKSHLADKYPEYPWLVKEYKEGILMFDLMDSMVWDKAVKDSTGLEHYFNRNREKYKHNETAAATIVMTNDTSVLNEIVNLLKLPYYPVERYVFMFKTPLRASDLKAIDSLYNSVIKSKNPLLLTIKGDNPSIDSFKKTVIPEEQYNKPVFVYLNNGNNDSLSFQVVSQSKKALINLYSDNPGLILRIDTGNFEKGTNKILNLIDWKTGNYYLSLEDSEYYVIIHKINPPAEKTLEEARGSVVSDYQKYLENEWLDDLKKKYPVKVDKKVLREIYHKFET